MRTVTKHQIEAAGKHLQQAVRILSPCAHSHPAGVKSKACPPKKRARKPKKGRPAHAARAAAKRPKKHAKGRSKGKRAREVGHVAYETGAAAKAGAPPLCTKDLRSYPIRRGALCRSGKEAAALLHDEFNRESQEVTVVVGCNVRGQVIDAAEIARGQKSRVGVGIDDVMYAVIRMRCETFVLAHYHPSGHCDPSPDDTDLTQTVFDACIPFGGDVTFVDHVVVGHHEAFSYAPSILKAYESNGKTAISKAPGTTFRV